MIAYRIFFISQPLPKRRGFPYGIFWGKFFVGRVAIGKTPTLLSGESRGGEGFFGLLFQQVILKRLAVETVYAIQASETV